MDLCIVAYRMGLARLVEDGEITEDEALDRMDAAEGNIRAYGLTVDDSPIFHGLFGLSKREEMLVKVGAWAPLRYFDHRELLRQASEKHDEQINNEVNDLIYEQPRRF